MAEEGHVSIPIYISITILVLVTLILLFFMQLMRKEVIVGAGDIPLQLFA